MPTTDARQRWDAWKIRERWERHEKTLGPLPEKWAKWGPPPRSPAEILCAALEAHRSQDDPFPSKIFRQFLR